MKGRVLSIIVAGAMIASTSTVLAATTAPKPKPTAKSTVKATPKPTPKPRAKAESKATKKPAVRKRSPKKVVYKRKIVKVSPSPSPKWPPSKPYVNPSGGEIYYKIPTVKELLGVLSAAAALATLVKPCTKYACGAVNIASTNGCTWWEIISTVSGPLSAADSTVVPYGTLRTTIKATNKKQIITVLLISTEPLKSNVSVGGINISCHHSPVTEKIPSNTYLLNTPTPTPSELATTNTN